MSAPAQYQLLPNLTDMEFDSLKADILARGVLVPQAPAASPLEVA